MDVGIDLGTATVIVYIGGEGVVLSEPSVIAVNLKTDSVISVGQEAYEMMDQSKGVWKIWKNAWYPARSEKRSGQDHLRQE